MSRRGVVAALAAGAAVNVPVIAVKAAALPLATAAQPVAHPDQALVDLGRLYDAALGPEEAASKAWTATCEAFDLARPAMPTISRHLMDDPCCFNFRSCPDKHHLRRREE